MYGKEREVITLKKGEVVQIIGPVVDVRFPPGNLTPIRNAIKIEDKKRNINLVAENTKSVKVANKLFSIFKACKKILKITPQNPLKKSDASRQKNPKKIP